MRFASLAVSGIFLFAMAASSRAALVVSDGDASAALTLGSNVVLAVDADNTVGDARTIQGVLFTDVDPEGAGSVSQGSVSASRFFSGTFGTIFDTVVTDIGSSGNDNALEGLAGDLRFAGTVYGYNVSGLTPGAQYKVDVIQAVGAFNARNQVITIGAANAAGAAANSTDAVFLATGLIYNSTFTVFARSNGTLSLSAMAGPAPADGGVISGFVISNAVPEPTSLSLLGLGGLALLRRKRA